MHDMTDEMLTVFYRSAMHVARSGNSSGDERPVPGDYRTRCPEGGDIMPEVSWTSDKHVKGVSVLVETIRTTFVFEINSSGYFSSTGQFIGQSVRRGTVRCSLC